MKRKIIVLKGGDSPEREISLKSGEAVEQALKTKGYKVLGVDPKKKRCFKITAGGETLLRFYRSSRRSW